MFDALFRSLILADTNFVSADFLRMLHTINTYITNVCKFLTSCLANYGAYKRLPILDATGRRCFGLFY